MIRIGSRTPASFRTGNSNRRSLYAAWEARMEANDRSYGMLAKLATLVLLVAAMAIGAAQTAAAEPIKIGFSMSLTGPVAANGKQVLVAMEIWRDEVNARGGLLGRSIEFVYYDDQGNPGNVPAIYTKLLDVDKVDLTIRSCSAAW
jgi:ABC-type branched-subunit amino acid transport system substrate-binding protein